MYLSYLYPYLNNISFIRLVTHSFSLHELKHERILIIISYQLIYMQVPTWLIYTKIHLNINADNICRFQISRPGNYRT